MITEFTVDLRLLEGVSNKIKTEKTRGLRPLVIGQVMNLRNLHRVLLEI